MLRMLIRPIMLVGCLLLVGATRAEGNFARSAQPIWNRIADAVGQPPLTLLSPKRLSKVTISYDEKGDETSLTARTSGRIGTGRVKLSPGALAELLWSGDASAFAVTSSDGGAVGTYHAVIVGAGGNGKIVSRDLSPLVIRAFGHPVKCDEPEDPNIAAVTWLPGSSRLIVAAEIPPHSNCDSFGTFRAYEVDWRSMRVVRGYDQITAKQLFGKAMGSELRSAPDDCVRRPRSCWVSTNHTGTAR